MASDASGSPHSFSILLIEDHVATGAVLQRLLRRQGFEVAVATCLAEVRKLAQQRGFDLVISDLWLPDGTGAEALAILRKNGPLPAIALSGSVDLHQSAEVQQAGFSYHFTKPAEWSVLLAAVQELARPT